MHTSLRPGNYGIIEIGRWQDRLSGKHKMGAPDKDQDQVNFIAAKVEHLFRTITRPDGKQFKYREVSEGTGLDLSYIRKLRVGKVANPSRTALEKLTVFFGVKPDYWFRTDNLAPLDVRQEAAINTANSSDVKRRDPVGVLLRRIEAADLSADDLKRLNSFLDELTK